MIHDTDTAQIAQWMASRPETASVAEFVPGPGIQRLALRFDIDQLRAALEACLARQSYQGDMQEEGFAALPLT